MSSITNNKVGWRWFVLVLFVILILGPWAFDLLNVPAQYPCEKPSVRLSGDFCGSPLSGFEAFTIAFGGFFYMLNELIKGNITAHISGFLILIYPGIIILPVFSILLLQWKKNSRRLQTINLVILGLACLTTVTMFVLHASRDQVIHFFYLLWGIWLYILVAIGTIVFEILVLRSNTKL